MTALPTFVETNELRLSSSLPRTWIWDRFLTPGKVSIFTSPAKDGKTTLISQVVAAMEHGGEVAGSAVAKGRVVVATEEENDDWAERAELLNIGKHVKWCFHPFGEDPTWDDWNLFVMALEETPADLYVIDPLSHFLPAYAENQAATVRRVVEPLRRLAKKTHASVLPLHHPSEAAKGAFNFRGSGSLKAYVDILIELKRLPGVGLADRRRVLSSVGRYPPPVMRTTELNAAGTATSVLAHAPLAESFDAGWIGLRIAFEDATRRMTRKEILAKWPEDYDKPGLSALRNWLEKASNDQLIERFGKGRCGSPFRYALTGKKFDRFDMKPIRDVAELDREIYG